MLLRQYKGLKEKLEDLRRKEMSFKDISDYFKSCGYRCSRTTVSKYAVEFNISTTRKSYRGKKNPFFQKKHTIETRKKISDTRIAGGYSVGEKNFFYGKTGKDSQNWRGGTSTRRAVFYASNSWKELRNIVFKRDNFTCLWCGNSSKIHNGLNAHHIIPLHMDWEKRLDINNLLTLCTICHKKTFNREKELIPFFQDIVRTSGRPDESYGNTNS